MAIDNVPTSSPEIKTNDKSFSLSDLHDEDDSGFTCDNEEFNEEVENEKTKTKEPKNSKRLKEISFDDEDEVEETPKKSKKISFDDLKDESDEETSDESDESDEPEEEAFKDLKKDVVKGIKELDEKSLSQKFKVPLEGDETEEVSLKDLINSHGKSKVADKRFQDAAKYRKDAQAFTDHLKNPETRFDVIRSLISKSGEDYFEVLQNEYTKQFTLNNMSEEDRQNFIKKQNDARDLKQFHDMRSKHEEEEKSAKHQKEVQEYYENITYNHIMKDDYLKELQLSLPKDTQHYILEKYLHFIDSANNLMERDPSKKISMEMITNAIVKEIKSEKLLEDKPDNKPTKVSTKVPGVVEGSGNSGKKPKKPQQRMDFFDLLNKF